MKQCKKTLALLTALILLCMATTGCQALDDMRARHATTIQGGITVNGTKYFPLPECSYFYPVNAMDEHVNITDADVPVLLSAFFADQGRYCDNYAFISSGSGYYCREDLYDKYNTLVNSPFNPTGYCYTYEVLSKKDHSYSTKAYRLTNIQTTTIDTIIHDDSGTPYAENATRDVDFSVELYACTNDLPIREHRYTLEKRDGRYYILDNDYIERVVPLDLNDTFNAIIKPAEDAYLAEQQYWMGEYEYGDPYSF